MKKLNSLVKIQVFLSIICVILLIRAIAANAIMPTGTTCHGCSGPIIDEPTTRTTFLVCGTNPGPITSTSYTCYNCGGGIGSISTGNIWPSIPTNIWDTGSFTHIWNPVGSGSGIFRTSTTCFGGGSGIGGIGIGNIWPSIPTNIWDTGSFTHMWNPIGSGIGSSNTFSTCSTCFDCGGDIGSISTGNIWPFLQSNQSNKKEDSGYFPSFIDPSPTRSQSCGTWMSHAPINFTEPSYSPHF